MKKGFIESRIWPHPTGPPKQFRIRIQNTSCVEYCTVQVEEIYDLQREPLVENKTCYGAIFLFRYIVLIIKQQFRKFLAS